MNNTFFVILLMIVVYPLYFIVIASFSDPDAVNGGHTFWMPHGITFDGYIRIFQDAQIWLGFKNSIIYMTLGTLIKVSLTITAGYVLSRKDLVGRNLFMFPIVFTMLFQGGMIPSYLLVKDLDMINTIWAIVLPGAISVFQLLIARTFFQSTIPDELLEAASMDGCSNWKFFCLVVIPISLPIIAVIVLFSAVSEWNSYFPALLYLRDANLQPLQIILRDILIQNQMQETMMDPSDGLMAQQRAAEQIKYGVIIIASAPMLILYPFLQRYFVQGVMIGSVKG
jgi:putative aldouronate transport system permease protein